MTHELKTPIATIGLSSEMLMKGQRSADPDSIQRYAGIIYKENKRLENQVERVLNLAQMDKNKLNLKCSSMFIHDLIQEVKENFEFNQADKGGKISLRLEATDDQIKADEVHVTNILFNLIDNAIKYCEKEPNIEVSTRNEKKGIVISIKDNGIGIQKDDLNNIFEKFFRVHTGNRHDVKGFGLGLFYVKTIIEAHKGRVTVQSIPNEGTTFSVYLPKLST